MHKLLRYLKGYEKQALLAPLFKMLEACFELFVPLVVASIIDTGIKNSDTVFIWQRCGLLVLLAVIGLTCSLTAQYFSAKAALGFGTALRKDLFRHIDTLSYSELDGIGTPTLVTRMTSDINQVQNGVNLTLRLLLRSPFIVIGALIMAFSISPKLTLLFVAATAVISLIIWLIMRATVPIYHQAQNGLDRVTLLTRENYVGARVVRAFARQADELADFVQTNDRLKAIQWKAGRISALMNPLTYLVVNLTVIALLLAGGREVDTGTLTQGEVIALINYMSQILLSLLRLADLVISVTRALASGMRVNEILNTATTMPDPAAADLEAVADAPAVAFDGVTFAYRGAGGPSLTDVSFTAVPGETVGVIGGTGSGKTTLIDLVARFYDAQTGGVRLFGHEIAQYGFAQLRRLVGIVPQKAALFSGTLRQNMQWGKRNASDEEIYRALDTAQAREFVDAKEKGLDLSIQQGGSNLSGGQRQRLTIARALVGRPKILILDDSASALDFATDAKLRSALRRDTGASTVFLISQRVSAVQNADKILVLEDGRLAGCGTHTELLGSCPVYREICASQSAGDLPADQAASKGKEESANA